MYENKNFMRDKSSNGIVNTDMSGLEAYRQQRAYLQQQKTSVSSLCDEVNNIKQEMKDIKELLTKILDK